MGGELFVFQLVWQAIGPLQAIGFLASTAVGGAALRLGAGLLLTAAFSSGRGRPAQADVKRDLRFATSRPQYRFVYGTTRAPGSEIPSPVVGGYFYAAYLLNSRPSSLAGHALYLDNRFVEFTGNPFDFNTAGAEATNEPFAGKVNYWIGRGDQTAPPLAFTQQAGFGNPVTTGDHQHDGTDELLWRTTDAGEGNTIIWIRMLADADQRFQLWPNAIPVVDVEGDFSEVYDPRDPAQLLDDPTTWTHSHNAALCALDCLTQNPFRPHATEFIDMDQWAAAADVAEETVALKDGGSQRRYDVSGVVTFGNGEIEQIVAPLMAAQAAQFVRVGGKLGIAPGKAKNIAATITESFGGLGYSRFRENIATQIRANYSSSPRGGEAAETSPWDIPGAPTPVSGLPNIRSVDLGLVPNAQQAQRIRNILGYREIQQAQLQLIAPADALDLLPGSWVTVDLPEPYGTRFNGTYEVQSAHPMVDPAGENGAAMRCALTLREVSSTIYDWVPATDEEDVENPEFSYDRGTIDPPGPITATTGPSVDLDTGSGIITRIRFEAAPSTSPSVSSYDWQYRVYDASAGAEDNWLSGGTIATSTVDAGGDIFAFLSGVNPALNYDIRVRTRALGGVSEWVTAANIDFGFELASVTASAPSAGVASFSFTTPNVNALGGVRIWRGATGSAFGSATILEASMAVDQDASDTAEATGVTAGEADFWIAPVTSGGSVGDVSGPFTLTIT